MEYRLLANGSTEKTERNLDGEIQICVPCTEGLKHASFKIFQDLKI